MFFAGLPRKRFLTPIQVEPSFVLEGVEVVFLGSAMTEGVRFAF